MEARERAEILARGRGAASNPKNRFERLELEPDPEALLDEDASPLRTQFLRDASRSIVTRNQSPDIPFDASLNPYRGCEHGCAYCYARPTHEFLGFSAGLDFESRIVVKEDAPTLLRAELSRRGWRPQVLAMSGVTDCYQPVERRLGLTRRCLEVLAEFRNPVSIITKNHLVTRDLDLIGPMAQDRTAEISVSITTLDPDLARILEPRASTPSRRLAAIREASAVGVPVRAMIAPVIPGLNDHEIPALLAAVREAGALDSSYTLLRLPLVVAPLFEDWLLRHFPDRLEKVLSRLRSLRGGRLNDPRFGDRMRGQGVFADQIRDLFRIAKTKARFPGLPPLAVDRFRVPSDQLSLFEFSPLERG